MGESSLTATVTQLSAFIDSGLSDINTCHFVLLCYVLSHLIDNVNSVVVASSYLYRCLLMMNP